FYGVGQATTSGWGVRLDNNRNVNISYSTSENAVIIERKDIDREFLRIGNAGVDFLGRSVSNLSLQKVTTEERPPAFEGSVVFDTDLKIPIFGDGAYWI